MRVRISRELTKGGLGWAQRGLFASAAVLLGYCGFVAADSWVFQHRESRNLERLLKTTSTAGFRAVAPKGLIGRLEIPRLGLSAVVIEGDDARTLRRAVGHLPGTPLPGQAGNVAFSGHRDTAPERLVVRAERLPANRAVRQTGGILSQQHNQGREA